LPGQHYPARENLISPLRENFRQGKTGCFINKIFLPCSCVPAGYCRHPGFILTNRVKKRGFSPSPGRAMREPG
jgi:hypothetical protein